MSVLESAGGAAVSLAGVREAAKSVSATTLAERHYARIAEFDGESGLGINSFLALSKERALAQATKVDELLAKGEDAGLLAGVPVAVKMSSR